MGGGRSGAHGPQALFLHDVPQLPQVGLGDGVVGLQVKRSEVIGFGLLQLAVEVEDGSQVHQGRGILKGREGVRVSSSHLPLRLHLKTFFHKWSREMPTTNDNRSREFHVTSKY